MNDSNYVLLIVGITLLLCGLVAYGLLLVEEFQCKDISSLMNFDYKYSVFIGCMINVNSSWMPLDSYYYEDSK